jgi:hypothetical protein
MPTVIDIYGEFTNNPEFNHSVHTAFDRGNACETVLRYFLKGLSAIALEMGQYLNIEIVQFYHNNFTYKVNLSN